MDGDTQDKDAAGASNDPRWQRAARLEDLQGDGPHALAAGGVDLVAVRSRGVLRVFEGRCPHQGALLGEGELEGTTLVCRNHRWKFDRESGARSGGRQCLKACPTREQGDELLVDVSGLARAADAVAYRKVEDLPGPRGLPLVGSTLDLELSKLHLEFEAWARQYGELFTVRLGPRRVLVVTKSELYEPILRQRPDTYRRTTQVETVFAELMGSNGVFAAEGEAWRAQRRLAMEALSQRHLRGFYPTLQLVTERLLRRWEAAADAERVLDIAEELKRFTVDVTTQLVFGHDVNTLERDDDDIIQRHLAPVFPTLNRRLNALVPYWRWIRLPQDRRVDGAILALRAWVDDLVRKARARLAEDPSRADAPANFLESMLVARDGQGNAFSDGVIFANALTMLLGGEDTTAYTLAWAVHHLCDDPRATAAMRSEIAGVLGERRVLADVEQAGRLAYTTAVANEAMRLRPVAPVFFFEPLRDVVVGDVAVPKGTMILLLTRAPVVEASRFGHPTVFKPERWIAGTTPGAHDAAASIPFGSGPRICPGRSLAILEMRVVLSALYRSFDVERVGTSADVEEEMAFTMHPVGLRVRLRRRSSVAAS